MKVVFFIITCIFWSIKLKTTKSRNKGYKILTLILLKVVFITQTTKSPGTLDGNGALQITAR